MCVCARAIVAMIIMLDYASNNNDCDGDNLTDIVSLGQAHCRSQIEQKLYPHNTIWFFIKQQSSELASDRINN